MNNEFAPLQTAGYADPVIGNLRLNADNEIIDESGQAWLKIKNTPESSRVIQAVQSSFDNWLNMNALVSVLMNTTELKFERSSILDLANPFRNKPGEVRKKLAKNLAEPSGAAGCSESKILKPINTNHRILAWPEKCFCLVLDGFKHHG